MLTVPDSIDTICWRISSVILYVQPNYPLPKSEVLPRLRVHVTAGRSRRQIAGLQWLKDYNQRYALTGGSQHTGIHSQLENGTELELQWCVVHKEIHKSIHAVALVLPILDE